MTVVFADADELRAAVGQRLGIGDWIKIDQQRIDSFADATGDHQWIHTDPIRAAKSRYGATIAHGFLTLSLIPQLLSGTYAVENRRLGINYGLGKARFITPVVAGSRLRAQAQIVAAADTAGGVKVTLEVTIELDGAARPACIAEYLVLFVF